MADKKYYTVWAGRNTGVFESWEECNKQVYKFQGARYKSFKTREEAESAFADIHDVSKSNLHSKNIGVKDAVMSDYIADSLAVDAACSGNPGVMEYRGVYVKDGREIFRSPVYRHATNNIGEFLAIVHGLACLKKQNLSIPVYSDSNTALSWIRAKKCKTTIPLSALDEELQVRIIAAEKWLVENTYNSPIYKWDTARWGEIPADFGRK